MQHKKLRRILKRYGRRVRAVQGKHRDENILKLMEMEKGRQEFVKFPAFARGQIGMIGKYSLLWYVIWLVLFVWGLNGDGMNVLGGHRNEILLSVMPPFFAASYGAGYFPVVLRQHGGAGENHKVYSGACGYGTFPFHECNACAFAFDGDSAG